MLPPFYISRHGLLYACVEISPYCLLSRGNPPIEGHLITRVYTPPSLRRQGIARKLLTSVCADADYISSSLFLHCVPDDLSIPSISFADLFAFYHSLSFSPFHPYDETFLTRSPKK